ncbi:16S rRNA (uracil1498-N3)-methyltransferase [Maridesulfovibrio ferrireducens]|uniref:Ribosomal RNA small subunit methyltransferase E n=1 Tax=Maridesulfovibrio ferrireducens TaxID=246191 RepID=A0A1G9I2X7_9BACT|nr:16S rRNA (uracil(1498)-N(3))-methyltransferase [Maridesulfovibrio ferrireducens]SDL19598.1 16S rRNA (uracil1498-N3)-methyltransferase [Maridesulfovibrio ferrireducens]
MSRLNSFYISPENWITPFVLEGSEARHMCKVLRTREGDTVRLFDGLGRDGIFTVDEISKSRATLQLVSETVQNDSRGLTLAIGWNKSNRRNWLLEKSVELQARGLIFFQGEFSQGKVPENPKDTWHDKNVAAAKQCGNVWLPKLETVPGSVENLIEKSKEFSNKIILWEKAEKEAVPDYGVFAEESTLAVIGPEGGFSPHEAELLLNSGFKKCSLGDSILRWETAALLCLGAGYLEKQKQSL